MNSRFNTEILVIWLLSAYVNAYLNGCVLYAAYLCMIAFI